MTIEMLLLATLLTSIAIGFSNFAKSSGLMARLVEGPWRPLQGMIEDGVWVDANASKAIHPNAIDRHGTVVGEDF